MVGYMYIFVICWAIQRFIWETKQQALQTAGKLNASLIVNGLCFLKHWFAAWLQKSPSAYPNMVETFNVSAGKQKHGNIKQRQVNCKFNCDSLCFNIGLQHGFETPSAYPYLVASFNVSTEKQKRRHIDSEQVNCKFKCEQPGLKHTSWLQNSPATCSWHELRTFNLQLSSLQPLRASLSPSSGG